MRQTAIVALASALTTATGAWAAPFDHRVASDLPVVKVANGCGPGFFRTIDGECRPNRPVFVGPRRGVRLAPPCPRGFLRDSDPARPLCYPVY